MPWSQRSKAASTGGEIAVGDDLPGQGWMRVEAVTGDGGLEAGSRRVQFAQQVRRAAQGKIGAGIRMEPVPMSGLPLRVHGDVPVDKGEHLPVVLDAQPTRKRHVLHSAVLMGHQTSIDKIAGTICWPALTFPHQLFLVGAGP